MKQTESEAEYSQSRTGERFWFTIAGYLAVTVIVLAYLMIAPLLSPGGTLERGGASLLFFLVFFSVLPYPAFVLDTSYIRRLHTEWTPSWQPYVAIGLLVPASVFGLAVVPLNVVIAVGVSSITFLLVTIALCSFHLYTRRKYLDVP